MLSEKLKFVPVLSDQDLNAAATMDGDSICMKNYHKCTFLIGIQTIGVASATVAPYGGITDGTCSAIVPFHYAFGSAAAAAANCDVLAAYTASTTAVTLTHGTYDNYMLIIEVDAAAMTSNYDWLTLRFTDPGGATGNVQVHAILTPRYPGNVSVTALA